MNETEEKVSFVFYRSWWNGIANLPREIQGEVLTAIVEYGLNGETTGSLKPIAKAVLELVKPQMDATRARYENGKKGAEHGKLGGNPNFKKGQPNPYYKEEKDNRTLPQDNPGITPALPQDNPYNVICNMDNEIITDNLPSPSNEEEASCARKGKANLFADIKRLWNETCTSYPKIVNLAESRKNKMRVRIEEMGGTEKAMPILRELFGKMQASRFLKGDNTRGWKATFDWLFENDKNWVKVYEGNYDKPKGNAVQAASIGVVLADNDPDKFDTAA